MPADGPTPAQAVWVERVLGVAAPPGRTPGGKLMPVWLDAREALDRDVAALQAALRSHGDADFAEIAEYGFNGLTGGRNTALMAALLQWDGGPGPQRAQAVQAAIAGYRALLDPGSILDDYDANPLGVAVSFRATLQRGLDRLDAALQTEGAA